MKNFLKIIKLEILILLKSKKNLAKICFLKRLKKIYDTTNFITGKYQKKMLIDKLHDYYWGNGGYQEIENKIIYPKAFIAYKEAKKKGRHTLESMRNNLRFENAGSEELVDYYIRQKVLNPDDSFPESYYLKVSKFDISSALQKILKWLFVAVIITCLLNILSQWIWDRYFD